MKSLVQIKFGSHLYGTATAESDEDYKTVFVPSYDEILLQRIQYQTSNRREKAHGEKNTAGDVDEEAFALHRYLELLAQGQTLAVDMLFAPPFAMMHEPAPIWAEIVLNRHRLISRRTAQFVTYCQRQAKKYGIKGSRVHAIRSILEWFDIAIAEHGHLARLRLASPTLNAFITNRDVQHTSIVLMPQPHDRPAVPHLDCCDRKASFNSSLKEARAVYQRMMDNFGARAIMAETNQNVDWKALSHAVRIAHEAIEFLNTGWVRFPRPEAEHLMAIKAGKINYAAVSAEIEELLEQVESAHATSTLPDDPDQGYIDELICQEYGAAVVDQFRK